MAIITRQMNWCVGVRIMLNPKVFELALFRLEQKSSK